MIYAIPWRETHFLMWTIKLKVKLNHSLREKFYFFQLKLVNIYECEKELKLLPMRKTYHKKSSSSIKIVEWFMSV